MPLWAPSFRAAVEGGRSQERMDVEGAAKGLHDLAAGAGQNEHWLGRAEPFLLQYRKRGLHPP